MANTWHITILLPRNGHCRFSLPQRMPTALNGQNWRLVVGTRTGSELHLGGLLSFPPSYINAIQRESHPQAARRALPRAHSCRQAFLHPPLHLGSRDSVTWRWRSSQLCLQPRTGCCRGPHSHTGISRLWSCYLLTSSDNLNNAPLQDIHHWPASHCLVCVSLQPVKHLIRAPESDRAVLNPVLCARTCGDRAGGSGFMLTESSRD